MNVARILFVIVSLTGVSNIAVAKGVKAPNCEIKGKKTHLKDKVQCEKKGGVFVEIEKTVVGAAPTTMPVPAVEPVKVEAPKVEEKK